MTLRQGKFKAATHHVVKNDSNHALPLPTDLAREPIPGYVVTERIGAGGYGEVWKADAPGGIAKAVKLVYGHLDDERAIRELKSLNRIKEVRHPFLISLERIEAVDGHLVIVSELAESNLKEQFDVCKESGMPGIPRDRLIGFLRDAADALDYLCEDHGLQHLDIKPENMLLVGGHVKLGDFGLVKELSDGGASLMGGLTPSYAPPEVFDGRPGTRSDQYSLAIVFQEMLTGALPFAGRTAAQLAAQHLHSRPKLDDLSPSDRNIIGRALSKDPEKRFPSCRDLVAALADPDGKTSANPVQPTAIPRSTHGVAPASNVNKTLVVDGSSPAAEAMPVRAAPKSLPPMELENEHRLGPTVLIGVGGTAGLVLTALRQRMEDRLGDLNDVPALQMLLLDTDRAALARVTENAQQGALQARETLAMPLRPTQDYRSIADKFLGSISRRWIYNVPRSLQTEGMRPLGRLALLDHADAALQRIQEAIATAIDANSIEHSSQSTGLPFAAAAPRIYLISSISGGTGSGMLLDLAYATRQILVESGLNDEGLIGVMTHSTQRTAAKRDLAVANSQCFLAELNQFSQPAGHYPGEPTCRLTSAQGRTFHHAYFAHLGDELDGAQYEAATDLVAEFIYHNTVTPAAEFFARCRDAEGSQLEIACPDTSLRSFGLSRSGYSNSDLPAQLADPVCRSLLEEWRGSTDAIPAAVVKKFSEQRAVLNRDADQEFSTTGAVRHLVAERIESLELQFGRLADTVHALAKQEMGRDADAYHSHLIAQYVTRVCRNDEGADRHPSAVQILDLFDTMLGTNNQDNESRDATFVSLQDAVSEHLDGLAAERGASLQQWCYQLADESRGRVQAAQTAADYCNEYLQALSRKAYQAAESLSQTACRLRVELCEAANEASQSRSGGLLTGRGKATKVDPRVSKYFYARLDEVVMRGVMRLSRLIANVHVAAVADRCRDLLRDLGDMAGEFLPDVNVTGSGRRPQGTAESDDDMDTQVLSALARRLPEFASAMEKTVFDHIGPLSQLLSDGTSMRKELPERLRKTAHKVIQEALRGIDVPGSVVPKGSTSENSAAGRLTKGLAEAMPRVITGGSGKRLMVVLPEAKRKSAILGELNAIIDEPLNVAYDSDNDLVFCYEIEGLALRDIANQVLDGRFDLAQVADRLHTRNDVDWSSL